MALKNNKQKTNITQPNSKSTDINERLEHSKYVYEQVNGWIENADNKVSVSCGIFTAVFGVLTFLAENHINIPENATINECWRFVYRISAIFSLIAMVIALLAYAWAIIPNLKSSGKTEQKKKYPIYYGDISEMDVDEYKKLMLNGSAEDFNDELLTEAHYNSGICLQKMIRYKCGVETSFAAIVLALVSFAARFMMYR